MSSKHSEFQYVLEGMARRWRRLGELAALPGRLPAWWKSRREQRRAFRSLDLPLRRKLVVFFIPGTQRVTGGVLQIFSLYRLTREFLSGGDACALICWLPGAGWDTCRFGGFDNDVTVFPLDMLLAGCRRDCELMFHIPEFAAPIFCERVGWRRLAVLREKHGLRINILNQNIEVMPGRPFLDRLREVFPDLTSTAGNPSWASDSERRRLGVPIYAIPTWYYPDDAPWQPYESKKDLMIVSPDSNPHRERVLDAVRAGLPGLEVRVIHGLKYEQYLELERSAKWSLTFGEGLDGYFYGPVFRGGVSFAARNATFDLPGLEDLRTVYTDYETMASRIAADLRALDEKQVYERYNQELRGPLARAFGRECTVEGLRKFYREAWALGQEMCMPCERPSSNGPGGFPAPDRGCNEGGM